MILRLVVGLCADQDGHDLVIFSLRSLFQTVSMQELLAGNKAIKVFTDPRLFVCPDTDDEFSGSHKWDLPP